MDFKLGKDVATSFLLRFIQKRLLNLQGMSLYMLIKSKPAENPPNPRLTPAHHYLHSTSPNVNPTGHASVCNACLRSSSRMQVVAGPMGVCRGMALREGRLPHQHHHTNTDNISRRQRCLPPNTPPPPMSTPQDMHPFAMRVYSYHLVCRRCPAQWVFVRGRCFRVWGISAASAPCKY